MDDFITLEELKDFLRYDNDMSDNLLNGIRLASIGRVMQHIKGTDVAHLDSVDVWTIKNATLLLCGYIDSGRISTAPNADQGYLPYEVYTLLAPWHNVGCA